MIGRMLLPFLKRRILTSDSIYYYENVVTACKPNGASLCDVFLILILLTLTSERVFRACF